MSLTRHSIGLLLASLLWTGCSAPERATEVLVVVNSDLVIGRELTNLQLEVYDRAGLQRLTSQPLSLATEATTAQFSLPLSYSLIPSAGVREFRLVVSGSGPGPAGGIIKLVEQQAIGAFRDGERLWIPIYLQRSCLAQFCRGEGDPLGDTTCAFGECGPVRDAPLEPAGPGKLGPNNGQIPDGPGDDLDDGGLDGGPDSGRDSATDADTSVLDADTSVPDADTGVPDADTGVPDADTGVSPSCGTWVPTDKDAAAPTNATAYGVEYNDTAPGTFRQYVCRVNLGSGIIVPGKGVFDYSCYYISLDNTTQSASDSFEVLVDTADCAKMTPVAEALANKLTLVPTGTGAGGEPLYSCVASRASIGAMPAQGISEPLGRYDPASNLCLFEWYNVTASSAGPFSVLTRR